MKAIQIFLAIGVIVTYSAKAQIPLNTNCNGYVYCQQGGTLKIVSATGNFAAISETNKTLRVLPGATLNGTIQLAADNITPSGDVAPLIFTPSWGTASNSWHLINGSIPTGQSAQSASVSLTIPNTPGMYNIIFAFSWEKTGDQVASASNWLLGHDDWNDGNDIAQFSSNQITSAQLNGYAVDSWLFPASGNTTEYASVYIPSDAITIIAGTQTPPTITTQPQTIIANAYDTPTFLVDATGSAPLNFQWAFDGTNIAGATASTLTVSNATQRDLGSYSVVVSNGFGSVTSSNAVLFMYPYIANPFAGAIGYWGQTTSLSVDAWGTALSYQWYDNGNAINGATSSELTFTAIQATNAGLYSVVVSSLFGSISNPPAQVIVQPAGVSLGLFPGVIIQGVAGYNYIIRGTTDLFNTNSWVTLTNLTLTQPIQLWVDTNTDAALPGNPHRFYRVLAGQ